MVQAPRNSRSLFIVRHERKGAKADVDWDPKLEGVLLDTKIVICAGHQVLDHVPGPNKRAQATQQHVLFRDRARHQWSDVATSGVEHCQPNALEQEGDLLLILWRLLVVCAH